MEQLEHPDFEVWDERRNWFENELENKRTRSQLPCN